MPGETQVKPLETWPAEGTGVAGPQRSAWNPFARSTVFCQLEFDKTHYQFTDQVPGSGTILLSADGPYNIGRKPCRELLLTI